MAAEVKALPPIIASQTCGVTRAALVAACSCCHNVSAGSSCCELVWCLGDIIIIIIFFNDKLTIATHYKIKDKYKINNVGLAIESSNTYKNQYKSL